MLHSYRLESQRIYRQDTFIIYQSIVFDTHFCIQRIELPKQSANMFHESFRERKMNNKLIFLGALIIGFFPSVEYTPSQTLSIGTQSAWAGSCDFISNSDLKNYCKGSYDFISNTDLKNFAKSRCDFISNTDLKKYCKARCDFISDSDLKKYCKGSYDFISNTDLKKYGKGRCDFISNGDLKLLCKAGKKFPGMY